MTRKLILAALALVATAGATFATIDTASALSIRPPMGGGINRPIGYPPFHRPHHRPHFRVGGGIVLGATVAPRVYEEETTAVRVCRRVVVGGYSSQPRLVTRCRLVAVQAY